MLVRVLRYQRLAFLRTNLRQVFRRSVKPQTEGEEWAHARMRSDAFVCPQMVDAWACPPTPYAVSAAPHCSS